MRKQRTAGFSLVELMIALVLGLILVGSAADVMISTKQTFQTTDELSRIQENGRFALDVLVRDIRMAGYRPPGMGDLPHFFFVDDCGGVDPCTRDGGGNASDRISVQYDPTNDLDCGGNPVEANDIIANVYEVLTVDNVNTLACRAWNVTTGAWVATAQPLIGGVDNLQLLYGLRSAANASVYQYVSADQVGDWANVLSVRVGLLVNRGAQFGQSDERTRSYVLLDTPPFSETDRHNRRVYSTTVTLVNAFNT